MRNPIVTVVIFMLVNIDLVQAETLFSHRDCEFTVSVPGKTRPMEKKTPIGPVYGAMSALGIRGLNRQLTFQVECQKMPQNFYNQPNATDITLNTMTQLNMKIAATNTSYDIEKTPFSVYGVSRGIITRISTETIMRTEIHLGRRSLLTLRVIAHRSDVDKIIANDFFKSVSR